MNTITSTQRNKYKLDQAQRLFTENGIVAKGFMVVDGKVVKQ